MQEERKLLLPDLEHQPNKGLPRSAKSTNNLLEEKMIGEPGGNNSIRFTNKAGTATVSTGDSSPRADSWDGDLGYPDLEDDDTVYKVTWYRWVMILLYSLFNVNCAIQIIGYNTLEVQLGSVFGVSSLAVTLLIVLP